MARWWPSSSPPRGGDDGPTASRGCRAAASGAFYAFPRVDGTGLASGELADRLLDEAGVVTLPGTGFGPEGEGYLRLSYANSPENLREGLRRIHRFLGSLVRA